MPENFNYKPGYTPLKVIELNPADITEMPMEEESRLRAEIQYRINVVALKAADFFDQTVTDAIVKMAREEGITTLVLLDKEFVVAAIREKMEREGLT